MKKLILSFVIVSLLSITAFAQVGVEDTSVRYENIQVYKVYTHPDAYVVMYYTKGTELGQVTLPVEWFKIGGTKGELRTVKNTDFSPYLTLQYVNDTFTKAILTMPSNRTNVAWGAMDKSVDVDGAGLGNTLVLE